MRFGGRDCALRLSAVVGQKWAVSLGRTVFAELVTVDVELAPVVGGAGYIREGEGQRDVVSLWHIKLKVRSFTRQLPHT